MAETTGISWTDATFNIAWGCTKISPGCTNCYADTLSDRYGFDVWGSRKARRTFGDKHWREPIKWNADAEKEGKRKKVFCSSMCDIFEDHPTIGQELKRLWPLIRATPFLDWQLLTKRSGRIERFLPPDWGAGYPNVWLGVSIENAAYAWRADDLRAVPCAVRFVSYEPALGPLAHALDLTGLSWLIYGGESGSGFRPEYKEWARDMRDACEKAGVAFWHKQSAAFKPGTGVQLDGKTYHEFPADGRLALPVLAQRDLF